MTIKRNGKRVYKSEKVLISQITKKVKLINKKIKKQNKKLKKTLKKRRKQHKTLRILSGKK